MSPNLVLTAAVVRESFWFDLKLSGLLHERYVEQMILLPPGETKFGHIANDMVTAANNST